MAIRQIEIYPNERRYLSESNPIYKDSMLYDQSLETLDIDEFDYVDSQQFENEWNNRGCDGKIY